jgi:hypothetical protein
VAEEASTTRGHLRGGRGPGEDDPSLPEPRLDLPPAHGDPRPLQRGLGQRDRVRAAPPFLPERPGQLEAGLSALLEGLLPLLDPRRLLEPGDGLVAPAHGLERRRPVPRSSRAGDAEWALVVSNH